MQVVQAVCGTFHHFDLARELESRGHLTRIYSTFPWQRLKREGVSRDRVRTYPWMHAPLMAAARYVSVPEWISRPINIANAEWFDAWVAERIEQCDAFVGISGSGLKAGRVTQRRGGKHVCDRGSSHIGFQSQILSEEFARWGLTGGGINERTVAREQAEYAQADAITVPSQFARRTFLEMGVDPAKVATIPYGVRLDRFQKSGEPASDSFDVLFAGAVSLRKGIPYLLRAFGMFKHPRKRLRLAGAILPEMQNLLAKFDLTAVDILGAVSQPQLAQWMSTSHIIALPSIEDGFGLVMSQAMACGTPTIASQNTGAADLFTDGVEGFIVPIRSAEAICERLIQLADDPDLRQRMSVASLARVHSLGGWRDYGQGYSDFLKTLTGQS